MNISKCQCQLKRHFRCKLVDNHLNIKNSGAIKIISQFALIFDSRNRPFLTGTPNLCIKPSENARKPLMEKSKGEIRKQCRRGRPSQAFVFYLGQVKPKGQ